MTMSLAGRKILIADDEPLIAMDLSQAFEALGAETLLAHDLGSTSLMARVEPIWAAVIDLKLKDQSALAVCAVLQYREIPFVIYTGYSEKEAGAYSAKVVTKPDLNAVIEKLTLIACSHLPTSRPEKPTLKQRVARMA